MPHRILLHFACNDPQNGIFVGRCGKVELSIGNETAAELDCGVWPPSRFPKFTVLPDNQSQITHVKLGRRKFPIRNYKSWVGNWCWDAAGVSPVIAAKVLNYLRGLKWHNEGGLCVIGDQWDRGEKFRASDIARLALTDEEFAARKRARGAPDYTAADAARARRTEPGK